MRFKHTLLIDNSRPYNTYLHKQHTSRSALSNANLRCRSGPYRSSMCSLAACASRSSSVSRAHSACAFSSAAVAACLRSVSDCSEAAAATSREAIVALACSNASYRRCRSLRSAASWVRSSCTDTECVVVFRDCAFHRHGCMPPPHNPWILYLPKNHTHNHAPFLLPVGALHRVVQASS